MECFHQYWGYKMAYKTIPIRNDLDNYQVQLTLDSIVFTFVFIYNYREEAWFLELQDEDGVDIFSAKLVLGVSLLRNCNSSSRPLGELWLYDSSGKNEEPSLTNFGKTVFMQYTEVNT
jgi:hypothetical protein